MAYGGRSQPKMSEETFDFVCTTCAQDDMILEAVKYCVECGGYCCQSCTDAHKKFPTLKGHQLIDVNQANQATSQQPRVTEFPIERCSEHAGKLLDMYCEGHDVVGCYVCCAKHHKSCQESHIHFIPDMIDTIFKSSDYKQTRSRLKDIMISMQTLSKSTDSRLQTLMNAKKEALDKVQMFQKEFEAIIRNIATASMKELETAYNELEKEILNRKQTVQNMCDDLLTIDGKLSQSGENRAERFVCTKIAQGKIKEANHAKTNEELKLKTCVQLIFIPHQSLVEQITALQGIGQVHLKQVHDLYKIKRSREIIIKRSDDSRQCSSYGCCLTHDDQLLVTDYNNKKLKRIDLRKMSVVASCTIDSNPQGICCVSKHEAAVACRYDNKIQFVCFQNTMIPTRQMKLPHRCYDIAFNEDKLYVANDSDSLHIYSINGSLLNTITHDNAGNFLFTRNGHIAFNEMKNRMFVGNWNNGVVCFDCEGNYLSTYKSTGLKDVDGVCVDKIGNLFVVGLHSATVVQVTELGNNVGVVVKKEDGIKDPRSVCFSQKLNRLFVTMDNSNVLRMYEVEQ